MTDAAPSSGERWWPRAVGATVLAVALIVALFPISWFPPAATEPGKPASIPARLPGYSYFTGDVSTSPPGRAVALFQHGFGVEFMDFPRAVVIGADANIYRRMGAAEARGGPETQGDPGPMLLSPGGTHVAVGGYDSSDHDLALIDLHTGDVELFPVPGGRSVIPLAWSPDSRQVAYLSTVDPVNPYSGSATRGDIGMLEVDTGRARLLPGAADARAVAFSPDGKELAIHRIPPDDGSELGMYGIPQLGGGTVDIVGRDDEVLRQLTLPADQYLDGPDAWSPDGALLATGFQSWGCLPVDGEDQEWDEDEWQSCIAEAEAISFVDASGRGAPVPETLRADVAGSEGVLGWISADELLVLDDVEPGPDAYKVHWVSAVSLKDQSSRRLSEVRGVDNYGVGDFQVAVALLPNMQIRDAGIVDRGPWPTALRVGFAVLVAGAALVIANVVSGRRRRRP